MSDKSAYFIDTENCSKLQFKIGIIFSQFYCFYCIFNQTNVAFESIRDFFKNIKNLTFEQYVNANKNAKLQQNFH